MFTDISLGYLVLTILGNRWYYFHFTHKETKPQKHPSLGNTAAKLWARASVLVLYLVHMYQRSAHSNRLATP